MQPPWSRTLADIATASNDPDTGNQIMWTGYNQLTSAAIGHEVGCDTGFQAGRKHALRESGRPVVFHHLPCLGRTSDTVESEPRIQGSQTVCIKEWVHDDLSSAASLQFRRVSKSVATIEAFLAPVENLRLIPSHSVCPAGPAWGIGPQPPAARCDVVSAEQAPSPAVWTRSSSRYLPCRAHGVTLAVTNPEVTRTRQQLALAGAHDKRANPDLTRRNGIEDSIDATAGIFVRRPVRNASNSLMSLTATLSR